MKKLVVILNNNYPLEPFLKNEIDSGIYDNDDILTVPFNKYIDEHENDIKDENIINAVPADLFRRSFFAILSVLRCIFDRVFWGEIKELFAKRRFSVKRVLVAARFYIIAETRSIYLKNVIKERLKTQKYEMVFYSYWMRHQAYVALRLKNAFPGSVCITRCHSYDLYEFRNKNNYIPFRKFILTGMDRIVPISKNGSDYLRENYNEYTGDRIALNYLGTYDHGLNENTPHDVFNIVSCSYLVPVKRVELIIKALSGIKDKSIKWTHYGDGVEKDRLLSIAKETLPPNVEWRFAGNTDNEELMKIYASSGTIDLFVNVSSVEGLPVSIMEAMSFGIPVIATDVGGSGEIVKDGINGVLLEKDTDADSISKVICEMMATDEEKRKEMRRNARLTWEENFNAKDNYERFYQMIISADEEK